MSIARKLYLLIALLALNLSLIHAQKEVAHKIEINYVNFVQENNFLRVNIEFNIGASTISSREQLILTPVIRGKNQELILQPLIVNGKTRHKVYLRQKAFGNLRDESKFATVVEKTGKREPQTALYSTLVDLEDWMKESALYLDETNCPDCGRTITNNEWLLTQRPILEEEVILQVESELFSEFIIPPIDSLKVETHNSDAFLKFLVGRYTIEPSIKENAAELEKIHSILDKLLSNENITINSISITGFASIEDTYASNMQLSENRAKALYTYIEKKYNLPSDIFHLNWVGEDWDGLVKLVEEGNMDDKQEVLRIIKEYDIFDGREKQLMELNQGRPYLFMQDEYFPLLRRINYVIDYTVRETGSNKEQIF